MSSQELTSVSSTTLSPCPSSIFSCNADNEIAEKSSNDTATIPSCLKHIAIRASVLEHTQNIQHQGNLMSEVAPESHPILICLQLLETSIHHIRRLQEALGIKPVEIPEKYSTQIVSGTKEYIAHLEQRIVESFELDIDIICVLPKGFADRFGTKGPSIRRMIFDEDRILETMRKLRMHCQDSEHVQRLPVTLRYAAATIIVVLLPEYDLSTSPNRQVQNNRNLRWASVQQEAYNSARRPDRRSAEDTAEAN
ncbi:uncharacterized protein FFFS_15763 [Fusarium fujikuroi]|nr:uncharacterized protein FFFS_15763 [Fusarium fujikuroi]